MSAASVARSAKQLPLTDSATSDLASANILLHEIFVDRHDRSACSSLEKCLTSAKIIVNSTYILFQISNDLLGMDPFLAFTWSVVGRALVRDLAVRRFWGDKEGEAAARRLAEDCLGFTKACNRSAEGIVSESNVSNRLEVVV